MNSRLTPCRASYKYIDECRLPKYFTVRATQSLHATRLSSLEAPPRPRRLWHPLGPRPTPAPTLNATRPLSVEQVERVQEVARQCLSTLVSLHKNEVIHCDLVRHAPTRSLALG